jgi:hypothetical protein
MTKLTTRKSTSTRLTDMHPIVLSRAAQREDGAATTAGRQDGEGGPETRGDAQIGVADAAGPCSSQDAGSGARHWGPMSKLLHFSPRQCHANGNADAQAISSVSPDARGCEASCSIKRPPWGGFFVERVKAPFLGKLPPIMKGEPGLTYRRTRSRTRRRHEVGDSKMRDRDRAPKCAENGPLLQFSGARQTRGSVLTTATFVLFFAKLKH